MRTLIFGASGLLGYKFYRYLKSSNVTGTYYNNKVDDLIKFNAQDGAVALLNKVKPQSIINCLGMTDVDKCEVSKDKADMLNYRFVGELVDYCKHNKAFLFHVSTDYIYRSEGVDVKTITEETYPAPMNYYGYTKMLAENIIKGMLDINSYTIIRPSYLYGYNGRNADSIRAVSAALQDINIHNVDNFYIKYPTLIDDIVYNYDKFLNSPGEYNMSSNIGITIAEWIQDAKIIFGIRKDKEKLGQVIHKFLAPRPYCLKYNMDKLERLGIKTKNHIEGLKDIEKQLRASKLKMFSKED